MLTRICSLIVLLAASLAAQAPIGLWGAPGSGGGGGGGVADPGANGLMKRTALNTTTPATPWVDYVTPVSRLTTNSSTSMTLDTATYDEFVISLTGGSVTSSTIPIQPAGKRITIRICQDATTGNRTFAWPATVTSPPTIVTTNGACTARRLLSNGTNWIADALPVATQTQAEQMTDDGTILTPWLLAKALAVAAPFPDPTAKDGQFLVSDGTNRAFQPFWQVQKDNPSRWYEFLPMDGTTTGGFTGASNAGGTALITYNHSVRVFGRPGLIRIQTGTAQNNDAIWWYGTGAAPFDLATTSTRARNHVHGFYMDPTDIATEMVMVGQNGIAASTGGSITMMYATSGQPTGSNCGTWSTTNWMIVARATTNGDPWCFDTTIPVAAATGYALLISTAGASATTAAVSVNQGTFSTAVTIPSDHVPTIPVGPFYYVKKLDAAATSKTIYGDYYGFDEPTPHVR